MTYQECLDLYENGGSCYYKGKLAYFTGKKRDMNYFKIGIHVPGGVINHKTVTSYQLDLTPEGGE